MKNRTYWWLGSLTLMLSARAAALFGQSATPSTAVPPALNEADIYVKIFGTLLAAVATLIGLPIVFLTYRKTRAEITKLELEARALRGTQTSYTAGTDAREGIRIYMEGSPNANVQVLADPRFLAPLLVLLDFIFASIVLTLAEYLFSFLSLEVLRRPALAVLATILLMPIARQVLRVRAVLLPPRTPEEMWASHKQARMAFCAVYLILVVSLSLFGSLFLTIEAAGASGLERFLAWTMVSVGVGFGLAFPIARRRFLRYLSRLHDSDAAATVEIA